MRAFAAAVQGLIAVTIAGLGTADAHAQTGTSLAPPVPDARLIAFAVGETLSERRADAAQVPRPKRRMASAVLGSLVGLAAGVAIVEATGPHHCQCDDPGLKEAAVGYLAGSALGAGFGAAMPGSDNPSCRVGSRLAPGLLGGTLGAGVGAGIGLLTRSPLVLLTTPFGASYGASRMLRHC